MADRKSRKSGLTTGAGDKPPQSPFPVSGDSPFPDKYDIEGERFALKDMVDAENVDAGDPRWHRYVELERREEVLRQMKSSHGQRGGANIEVSFVEATHLNSQLGSLVSEAEDTMTIHTNDGRVLFAGRTVAPGESGYDQSGAKRVGAALRAIWYLAGAKSNPYADFALIEASSRVENQIQVLESEITRMEAQLDSLKKRGLSFSVLRADPPVTVALGFRSPYGYSMVRLVSTYDYFCRVARTMVHKDLVSKKEGHEIIYPQTRACRSIFERVIYFQRYLMRDVMRPLSRADWLPTADEEAKKRVLAAVKLFGELPREVFTGEMEPRHTLRNESLSEEELRLLNELPLVGAEPVLEAAEGALV